MLPNEARMIIYLAAARPSAWWCVQGWPYLCAGLRVPSCFSLLACCFSEHLAGHVKHEIGRGWLISGVLLGEAIPHVLLIADLFMIIF